MSETQQYKLKAMAKNYAGGHRWDHLDSDTCSKAAEEIGTLLTANQRLEGEVARLTALAQPDAELVELLRSKFPRIDPCQPVPLDEKAHCCEYTIYVERERLHRLIDAKLASLEVKP